LLDQDRFIDCNAVALQLIGAADKTQVIQHHPSELSPERQPDGQLSSEKAQFLMSTALRTGSQRFEWLHRRLDGGEVWVEVLLTAVPWQGQRVLHAIWRDLTERRRIEERQRLRWRCSRLPRNPLW
jgi:two-component system NtrC family sensor kinase